MTAAAFYVLVKLRNIWINGDIRPKYGLLQYVHKTLMRMKFLRLPTAKYTFHWHVLTYFVILLLFNHVKDMEIYLHCEINLKPQS